MKKQFVTFLLLCLGVVCRAGVYNPENIPLPANGSGSEEVNYISNPDGLLADWACSQINEMLSELEDVMGVKTLVMVVDRIEGGDLYDFSLQVGNKYGIGDAQTNKGLILTVATHDNSWQILTGEGLESLLTDANSGRVGRQVLMPLLEEEKLDSAMVETVDALSQIIRGEPYFAKRLGLEEEESTGGGSALMWILAAIGLAIVGGVLYVVGRLLFSLISTIRKEGWKAAFSPKRILLAILGGLLGGIFSGFNKRGSRGGGSFGGGGAGG